MSEEDEDEEERLVGTPCPVPNCQGFVKNVSKDPNLEEFECDYGHILEYEQVKKR
ncbi:MAG: hypothetical protein WB643_03980 [Candidatus Bathyarchaeia archaeon]|jgi:hypothetical protein